MVISQKTLILQGGGLTRPLKMCCNSGVPIVIHNTPRLTRKTPGYILGNATVEDSVNIDKPRTFA